MKLLHRDIARNAPWIAQRNLAYLMNAHRLDIGTSGVILLAKNKPALVHLANQFGRIEAGENLCGAGARFDDGGCFFCGCEAGAEHVAPGRHAH